MTSGCTGLTWKSWRHSFQKTRQILAEGNRWLVIFPEGQTVWQNDTVMPFQPGVVQLAFKACETVFEKRPAEAYKIMMQVHSEGSGICGSYIFEVAETKVAVVHELAKAAGFPLRASLQEA